MRPDLLERLHADPDLTAFAVVDGALVDALPGTLAGLGCVHYCLYLGELSPDLAAVAPWLVMLPPGSAAATWWAGQPAGACAGITGLSTTPDAIALRRHLRTLTTVLQPRGETGEETVLLRFYDPVVLNQLMPLLDDAQQARLFGPLAELWAEPEGGGPPIVHLRRPFAGAVPPGLLRLSAEQVAALDANAVRRFEAGLAAQLQEDYPDTWGQLAEPVRLMMVGGALDKARGYGLTWESSLTGFLHLMASVNPRFDTHPVIQAALTRDILPPDERMMRLLEWDAPDVWAQARTMGHPLDWPLREKGEQNA